MPIGTAAMAFAAGSLGSGNHFIEVTVDELDRIWLSLHSGSAALGTKLRPSHQVAQRECDRCGSKTRRSDLAYLVEGTDEFWAYIHGLRWAQKFALLNREENDGPGGRLSGGLIGAPVVEAGADQLPSQLHRTGTAFGRDVWLSRKGAINRMRACRVDPARWHGQLCGAGKGNRLASNSSRTAPAGRILVPRPEGVHPEQLREAMAGIEWRDDEAVPDEIPAAYKDIDRVMADAADLVTIRTPCARSST